MKLIILWFFFESPLRIFDTLSCLNEFLSPKVRICLCKEISKKFEKVIRGNLEDVLLKCKDDEILKGEWTCILESIESLSKISDCSKIGRNIDEVCSFFDIKRSKAAKILAIVSNESRHDIYKNS